MHPREHTTPTSQPAKTFAVYNDIESLTPATPNYTLLNDSTDILNDSAIQNDEISLDDKENINPFTKERTTTSLEQAIKFRRSQEKSPLRDVTHLYIQKDQLADEKISSGDSTSAFSIFPQQNTSIAGNVNTRKIR